jgi:hypothetical protein
MANHKGFHPIVLTIGPNMGMIAKRIPIQSIEYINDEDNTQALW